MARNIHQPVQQPTFHTAYTYKPDAQTVHLLQNPAIGAVKKIAGRACFAACVRQLLALFGQLIAITPQPLYAQTPVLMLGTGSSDLQLNTSLIFLLKEARI